MCPSTECRLAPQPGAWHVLTFPKVLVPGQGWFCFSKRELISHLPDFKWFKINKTTQPIMFPSLQEKSYLMCFDLNPTLKSMFKYFIQAHRATSSLFLDNFWHICVQLGSSGVTSAFLGDFQIYSLCCVRIAIQK